MCLLFLLLLLILFIVSHILSLLLLLVFSFMLILLFFTADAAAVAVVVTVPWRSFYECVLLFLVYFQRICRLFSLRFLLVYFVALYMCVCVS